MTDPLIVVLITAPSPDVARQIAAALLEGKLAACVNVLPGIRSLYTWKGQPQEDEEVLMLVKTRAALFESRLVPAVKAVHPYELPEIIAVPILMGLEGYLDWIRTETGGKRRMKYDFDTPIDRRSSESIKWRKFDEDVLPMWVADMDFRSPPQVIQALHERIEDGVFGYPVGSRPGDLPVLRRLIVARMAERYQWHIDPDDILFQPGVGTAFKLASLAFASPERALLVQTPLYPPLLGLAQSTAVLGRVSELVRQPDGSYPIDFEAFEAAARDRTGLFMLCNPHNPTGRVFRRDELQRLAEICLRHGVVICSDEIHCDLVYSGQRHTPIASLDPEVARRTVTLMAPSKTFNLAGLKFSFTIVQDPELKQRFLNAGFGLGGWANLAGLTAAQAAYKHGGEWLEQLIAYLEGNRDYLDAFVQEELPGVRMAKPEGTYLGWLDCRGMDALGGGSPCEFFLKEARVALGDGREFGHGGDGFVRLNFGCSRGVLAEALERMKRALKGRDHI